MNLASQLWAITKLTFIELRRDRIFLPVIFGGLAMLLFANIASDWSVQEHRKILFDISSLGVELLGIGVAIFWGSDLLGFSNATANWEVQLVAPIGRGRWLVGRFLGLVLWLLSLMFIFTLAAQSLMFAFEFGWMSTHEFLLFVGHFMCWLVVASVAIYFGTFCDKETTMFATASSWILGLFIPTVASTLSNSELGAASLIHFLARVWNLQRFHTVAVGGNEAHLLTWTIIMLTYGLALTVGFLSAAVVQMERRDLAS